MLNNKVTLALAVITSAFFIGIVECGPATYATCQAGCAAALLVLRCVCLLASAPLVVPQRTPHVSQPVLRRHSSQPHDKIRLCETK